MPGTAGVGRLAGTLFGPASVGRYAVIGLSGVTLDTLLFYVLTRAGVLPLAATVVSTLVAIGYSYVMNAHFNFRRGLDVRSGWRFVAVGLLGLLVAAVSLQVLIVAGLDPLPAKLVSLPCVLAAQFLANKHWSFRAP